MVSDSGAQQEPSNARRPSYAALFRCIGPECEDPCCGGWDIPVDKITYQAYRRFPPAKLGDLVARYVSQTPGQPHDSLYGRIHHKEDGSCPFFGSDRLCGIQKEYGPKLLTSTCSIYPRSLTIVDGTLEGSLSLSCPEAARALLLNEGATQRSADLLGGEFRTDNAFALRPRCGLEASFPQIRALIAALIEDRSRPIWQRLILIALFCSRLDDVAEKDLSGLGNLLGQYSSALGQGASSELDGLETRISTRLELAIAFTDQRCRDRDCGQRFRDVYWDFVEGIGTSVGDGPATDVLRFREAERTYLEPLLARFPFMLENYLLNYLYQHLFPFGIVGSERFIERSMFDEAVLLITRFSWLTTLLTGVAGKFGPAFVEAHVITTVQSFTRAVEHVPRVLEDALEFVKARHLDDLAGLGALLKP